MLKLSFRDRDVCRFDSSEIMKYFAALTGYTEAKFKSFKKSVLLQSFTAVN